MKTTNKIILILLCLWTLFAEARQPQPPKIKITTEFRGHLLLMQLQNMEKFDVDFVIKSGPLSSIGVPEQKLFLRSQQTETLQFELKMNEGLQVLNLNTQVHNDRLGTIPGPDVYQALKVSPNMTEKLDYSKAFLSRQNRFTGKSIAARINLGGAYYSAGINPRFFLSQKTPEGAQIEPIEARSPLVYAQMKLKQLPRETTVGEGKNLSAATLEETLQPQFVFNDEVSTPLEEDTLSPMAVTTFRGTLSLKMSNSSFKSAWGWVVRVWQKVGSTWTFKGWAYVGGDGRWQVTSTSALPGLPTWIEYQTKNRFVSIQDAAGNPYTWGDAWTLTGTLLDVGSRYADLTTTGDLPGVDHLYVGATNLWVKFYNNGVNALRNEPIRVYYPNTLSSGSCIYNDGSGPYAWSCSYWSDGRIYIIPAHASASVVQHEAAHSINSYYWSGSMPPGSGGSHNLWDCYNPGLALSEGWADFVAYWVQFNRNETNPVAGNFGGMNIESIPAGVCASQNAEMRTASTFWDTYDYWNDGPNPASAYDSLLYTNQGVPISIYLGNKKDTTAQYLAVMKSGQSTYWQGEFTKLFRLNKIIP